MNGFINAAKGYSLSAIQELKTLADSMYITAVDTDGILGEWTDAQIEAAKISTDPDMVYAINNLVDQANQNNYRSPQPWSGIETIYDAYASSYSCEPPPPGYDYSDWGTWAGNHNNAVGSLYADNKWALECAVAYRLTDNTAWADRALLFLNAWVNADARLMAPNYITASGGDESNLPIPDLRSSGSVCSYYDQSGCDSSTNQFMMGFIRVGLLLRNYSGWQEADKTAFTAWINATTADSIQRLFLPGEYEDGVWFNPEWPIGQGNETALLTQYLLDAWNNDTAHMATFTGVYLDFMLDEMVQPLDISNANVTVYENHMVPNENVRGENGIWYTCWNFESMTASIQIHKLYMGVNKMAVVNSHGSSTLDGLDKLFYYLDGRHNEWNCLSGNITQPADITSCGSDGQSRWPDPTAADGINCVWNKWFGVDMYQGLAATCNRPEWKTWSGVPKNNLCKGRTTHSFPTVLEYV